MNKYAVVAVLLVGFHHRYGPRVEHVHPPLPPHADTATSESDAEGIRIPAEWAALPFMCLPDGAHHTNDQAVLFQLPPVEAWRARGEPGLLASVFGAACYRQIDSAALRERPADVTRGAVQKAVAVLTSQPALSVVAGPLAAATEALFASGDFGADGHVALSRLYDALCARLTPGVSTAALLANLALADQARAVSPAALLVALKAVLLERRVLCTSRRAETLGQFQYALVSLVPGLLRHLAASAAPALAPDDLPDPDSDPGNFIRDDAGRAARLREQCLPLRLFGCRSVFLPYVALQLLETLGAVDSYLAGTNNQMVAQHPLAKPDVILDLDQGRATICAVELRAALDPTPADARFCDQLVSSLADAPDPAIPQPYAASDDSVRAQFADYLAAGLAHAHSVYTRSLHSPAQRTFAAAGAFSQLARPDFSSSFVDLWVSTPSFQEWYFDIVDSGRDLGDLAMVGAHPAGRPTGSLASRLLPRRSIFPASAP